MPQDVAASPRETFSHDWGSVTEPGELGREIAVARGKLVGGSSSINNAITLTRGYPTVANHNAPGAQGIGPVPVSRVDGIRQSTALTYHLPAPGRNLPHGAGGRCRLRRWSELRGGLRNRLDARVSSLA